MLGVLSCIPNPVQITDVWDVFGEFLVTTFGPDLRDHGGLVSFNSLSNVALL